MNYLFLLFLCILYRDYHSPSLVPRCFVCSLPGLHLQGPATPNTQIFVLAAGLAHSADWVSFISVY